MRTYQCPNCGIKLSKPVHWQSTRALTSYVGHRGIAYCAPCNRSMGEVASAYQAMLFPQLDPQHRDEGYVINNIEKGRRWNLNRKKAAPEARAVTLDRLHYVLDNDSKKNWFLGVRYGKKLKTALDRYAAKAEPKPLARPEDEEVTRGWSALLATLDALRKRLAPETPPEPLPPKPKPKPQPKLEQRPQIGSGILAIRWEGKTAEQIVAEQQRELDRVFKQPIKAWAMRLKRPQQHGAALYKPDLLRLAARAEQHRYEQELSSSLASWTPPSRIWQAGQLRSEYWRRWNASIPHPVSVETLPDASWWTKAAKKLEKLLERYGASPGQRATWAASPA